MSKRNNLNKIREIVKKLDNHESLTLREYLSIANSFSDLADEIEDLRKKNKELNKILGEKQNG